MIEKNLSSSVAQCYKDACSNFPAKMSDNEKMSFLTEIASLYTWSGNLYKLRNPFIPKSSESSADFEINSDWCQIFYTKESICMADIKTRNKSTVIMITKKILELMARSKGFGVDSTFQLWPKQLYQLSVMRREISKTH